MSADLIFDENNNRIQNLLINHKENNNLTNLKLLITITFIYLSDKV